MSESNIHVLSYTLSGYIWVRVRARSSDYSEGVRASVRSSETDVSLPVVSLGCRWCVRVPCHGPARPAGVRQPRVRGVGGVPLPGTGGGRLWSGGCTVSRPSGEA